MASDSGHWYAPDGTPRHTTKAKDGGMRNTTLRDARKEGLLPSVSGIIGILDKPALTRWKVKQGVLAVVTAPDVPGEGLDAKINRILDEEKQHEEEGKLAADRGTQAHDTISKVLHGAEYNKEFEWAVPAVREVMKYGKPHLTERVVIGNGYAGTMDLCQEQPGRLVYRIWDWKTCTTLPERGAWPEHQLQLAAYAAAIFSREQKIICANVYICTRAEQLGQYVIWEHEQDWREVYDWGFEPLMRHWVWSKGYAPPGYSAQ